MKKLSSILLSLIIIVSSLSLGSFSAFANTKRTAVQINLYETVFAATASNDRDYWISFEPQYDGFYEFVCHSLCYNGTVVSTIYDSAEEVLMMNVCDASSRDFITAAELEKGETYYFVIEAQDVAYSTNITLRPHNHSYNSVQNYPAVYDADDAGNCLDGGNYTFCAYCTDCVTNAVYFYPVSFTLSTGSYTYNGKKKCPSVTVRDRMGNVIASSNYSLTYKNNTNPGRAAVVVTFNGANYCGSVKLYYTIKPKAQSITYLKTKKSKQFTLKWKKDKTVSGYQIQYSTSKKFYKSKTKTVTFSKKTLSKTVSKLKSKKKYYVRVRAYKTVDGKKIYGSWSKVKTVKVK